MIESDTADKFVLDIDLGQDRIYIWTLDRTTGQLVSPTCVSLTPRDGAAPFCFPSQRRHFVLAPSNERTDALTTFRIRHKKLELTGKYTPVGSPACVIFLT